MVGGSVGDTYRDESPDDRSRYASEISSSLPLQVLMYYNILSSAVYFVLEGGLVIAKVTRSVHVTSAGARDPVLPQMWTEVIFPVHLDAPSSLSLPEQLSNYVFSSLLQRMVLSPAFVVWSLAEVLRIYFGYKGNIKEMVGAKQSPRIKLAPCCAGSVLRGG